MLLLLKISIENCSRYFAKAFTTIDKLCYIARVILYELNSGHEWNS